MSKDRLSKTLAAIDQANGEDPNTECWQGQTSPKELLYSKRMTAWLEKLDPCPSAARQIAARAQHIRRWTVRREDFPPGREGYLRWRTFLYRFHADQAEAILRETGYDAETIALVRKMVGKQGIKRDPDVQMLEDVACLVFLEHYFPAFAEKHDEEKMIGIVRKTWQKMSGLGQSAAMALQLPEVLAAVLGKALNRTEEKSDGETA
jgi:hypothetical protein